MKKIIFGIALVFMFLILVLSYIGILTIFSPLMPKPRDLGVSSDPNFIAKFDEAHGIKNLIPGGVVPIDRQAEFEGSVKLDIELTSQDVTSILNGWKKRSPKLPIRDVQVRFSEDGTAEIAGIIEVGSAIGIAKVLGYSDADINKGKQYVQYIAGDLPFYVKGVGSVASNKITLSHSTAEIGRVKVPDKITEQAMRVVEDMIERRIRQVGLINVDSLTHHNGMLQFKGTVPNIIK